MSFAAQAVPENLELSLACERNQSMWIGRRQPAFRRMKKEAGKDI
jgi:hypothetical protein